MIELSEADRARIVADTLAPNEDPVPSMIQLDRVPHVRVPLYMLLIRQMIEHGLKCGWVEACCINAGIPVAAVMSGNTHLKVGIAVRARHAPRLIRLINGGEL